MRKYAGDCAIAFPAIGTGSFGYPAVKAARLAVETLDAWLRRDDRTDRVVLCAFGAEAAEIFRQTVSG